MEAEHSEVAAKAEQHMWDDDDCGGGGGDDNDDLGSCSLEGSPTQAPTNSLL